MDAINQFFQTNAAQMWIVLACLVFFVEAWVVFLTWRLFRMRRSLPAGAASTPAGSIRMSDGAEFANATKPRRNGESVRR